MAEQKLKKCDSCGEENLFAYVDGKTKAGPWANLCLICHLLIGVGLGMGRGQRYEYQVKDHCYKKVVG